MDKTRSDWAAEAIRVLGGATEAAAIITKMAEESGTARAVSRQSVEYFVRQRVPAEFCPLIERATRERGRPVLCEQLRPDVEWRVLREPAA